MNDEPSTRRRPRGAFALVLVLALVLAAAIAPTAGATSLDFGSEQEGSGFTASGETGVILGTDATLILQCDGAETGGAGVYAGESNAYMTFAFYSCAANGAGCHSPGQEGGVVLIPTLAMDFTELPGEEGPAVVLYPIGTDVFVQCGSWKLEGGVIGEITSPEEEYLSDTLHLRFIGADGEQEHTETHRGRDAQLTGGWLEGSDDASFNWSFDLEFEDELEPPTKTGTLTSRWIKPRVAASAARHMYSSCMPTKPK